MKEGANVVFLDHPIKRGFKLKYEGYFRPANFIFFLAIVLVEYFAICHDWLIYWG